ncbi:helix-turn-helix transcriptional regulator [Actinomadura kijaniata]|uniref:helix-turn-helix transcriptional regulator n=1 Tax=Actinomadura kijaniata TaxID=46161 RepID=UPI0008376D07|nr:helix-turn-helix transcriptional regulator [Actinomadura kijaniata]
MGEQRVADTAAETAEAVGRAIDPRAELGEFLRSRRARLRPADVGLPDSGRYRRVPGLRREELAQLAGVSVAYLTRLEQGRSPNVSDEVLDAIARALRLTGAERAHLEHLARRQHRPRPAPPPRQQVRPALRELLASLDGVVPAYVAGRRSDILAWNPLVSAVFGDWDRMPPEERNCARLIFLNPDYRALFVDWEAQAAEIVAALRLDAGRHPDDPRLVRLVGELSVKSADFRRLWARHDVKENAHGLKHLRHPLVGELKLSLETLRLPADPDQALILYHAAPGSPTAENLRLLASWGPDATSAPRA